jgi:hypothetical protein
MTLETIIFTAWYSAAISFLTYGIYEYFIVHNLTFGPTIAYAYLALFIQRIVVFSIGWLVYNRANR